MTKVKSPWGLENIFLRGFFTTSAGIFPHAKNFPEAISENLKFIFLFKYDKISC